jgi:hypothetical protein
MRVRTTAATIATDNATAATISLKSMQRYWNNTPLSELANILHKNVESIRPFLKGNTEGSVGYADVIFGNSSRQKKIIIVTAAKTIMPTASRAVMIASSASIL